LLLLTVPLLATFSLRGARSSKLRLGFDTPHRNYCFIPYERRENCLADFYLSRPSEFPPHCSPASCIVSVSFLPPTSRCPPLSTASAKCATTPTPRSIARSSPHQPKLSPPSVFFAPPPSYNYRPLCLSRSVFPHSQALIHCCCRSVGGKHVRNATRFSTWSVYNPLINIPVFHCRLIASSLPIKTLDRNFLTCQIEGSYQEEMCAVFVLGLAKSEYSIDKLRGYILDDCLML